MALEGKDFDDRSIMSATRQEAGPNGTFRLKIKLPISGREVASEWISEDHRRKALFAWVDVVRGQVQGDAEDHEAERKAKILSERAKQEPLPGLVGIDGVPMGTAVQSVRPTTTAIAGVTAPAGAAVQTAPSSSSLMTNPDEYINQQLKLAMIRAVEADDVLDRATQERAAAQKNLVKWQKLQDALAQGVK